MYKIIRILDTDGNINESKRPLFGGLIYDYIDFTIGKNLKLDILTANSESYTIHTTPIADISDTRVRVEIHTKNSIYVLERLRRAQ